MFNFSNLKTLANNAKIKSLLKFLLYGSNCSFRMCKKNSDMIITAYQDIIFYTAYC